MNHFEDTHGNKWYVEVNVATLKSIRDRLGLDFVNTAMSGLDPLSAIASDMILLVDMIYLTCEEQADKRGFSDIEFGKSLNGEAIERAYSLFIDGLINFSRSPSRRKALQLVKTAMEREEAEALKVLSSPEMMQQMESVTAQAKKMAGELL